MAAQQSGNKTDRRVRVSKTAELIADVLRSRIARGDLKKGDVLPNELELTRQFEVSRPTLREAFRILESESLILVRRGSRGGVIVSSPDTSIVARNFGLLLQMQGTRLADIYGARRMCEPACARILASQHAPQDMEVLGACVEALAALVNDGNEHADFTAWSIAALEFHDLLVQRSGNTTLALFSSMLSEIIGRHMSQLMEAAADRAKVEAQFRKVIRAFRKLLSLIGSGDADEAERFWRRHLEIAGSGVIRGRAAYETVVDLYVQTPLMRQLGAR